jgi:hypothetical protein
VINPLNFMLVLLEHRPWELYQKVFYQLLWRCHGKFLGKKKFRFKNKLMSFDASLVVCKGL